MKVNEEFRQIFTCNFFKEKRVKKKNTETKENLGKVLILDSRFLKYRLFKVVGVQKSCGKLAK